MFFLWLNPALCLLVNHTASCQRGRFVHPSLVGVLGTGKSRQGWVNPHCFNDARRQAGKGICIPLPGACASSARTKLSGHRLAKEKKAEQCN